MRSKWFQRKIAVNIIVLLIASSFSVIMSITGVSLVSDHGFSGSVYAHPGVPISNATVTAYGSEGYGLTTTNTSGQYAISEGLKTGNYIVSVSAQGYLWGIMEDVQVTAGETTSGKDFYLNLSGGISGRVTDADSGLPLQNIMVEAFMPSNMTYGEMAMTDENGDYHIFTNLATGIYNVSVFLPEGHIGNEVSGIEVTAGVTTTNVDFELEKSGILSGRITAFPSGEPLENAYVSAGSDDGKYGGDNQTDATGYYRISSGLGTGNYTVIAMYEQSMNTTSGVSVVAGDETPDVDLSLAVAPPPPSGIITGNVTDIDDNPIEGAMVTAEGPGFGYNMTDENGEYIISSGLLNGTYTVFTRASGYEEQNVTGVSVTEGEITSDINFQLSAIPPEEYGTISGTVQGDENPIPELQHPVIMLLIATLTVIVLTKTSKIRMKRTKTCPSK